MSNMLEQAIADAAALREQAIRCRQRYLLRVQRGQGRAVGAAEDHMVCLELF